MSCDETLEKKVEINCNNELSVTAKLAMLLAMSLKDANLLIILFYNSTA